MLVMMDMQTESGRAAFAERLERLRNTAGAMSPQAQAVQQIVQDVRTQGDGAVVRYMRQWTDPDFTADRIVVPPEALQAAFENLDPALRQAIETSIDHVRQYQQHILPHDPEPIMIDGAELGLRYRPIPSVGLCVPGGAAVLFSTLIMLAVPALVAGVDPDQVSVMNPPPTRRGNGDVTDLSPVVLATCHMLGLSKVYRLGGAQGVAALAYGTEHVKPVQMIAGPGNVFVQLAKQQVAGVCGTDGGFYGPSEIVTLADDSADPRYIAADLIAQAEHNPGKCFLIAWSDAVLQRITQQVQIQTQPLGRASFIREALEKESAALRVRDEAHAIEVADTIAAEHVNLAVRDPQALLEKLAHGGEFFLGDQTPVAAGDYYAGPSHCLPTGTTARFSSGISAITFLKRSGTVCYPKAMDATTIHHIAQLASAEGLEAHANSAKIRSATPIA